MPLHRYEIAVLNALESSGAMGLDAIMGATKLGKDTAMWVVENLSAKGLVSVTKREVTAAALTDEGKAYADTSLPEDRLVRRVAKEPVDVRTLKSKDEQIALQWAKRKEFIEIAEGKVRITLMGSKAAEVGTAAWKFLSELQKDPDRYQALAKANPKEAKELSERHLVEVTRRSEIEKVEITKAGRDTDRKEAGAGEILALTKEMIMSKGWQGKGFAPYNLKAEVEGATPARLHPVRRIINEVRQAYLGMGFMEATGPIVESAFWVFDHLFMPQDHPARDVQDTFFLENPKSMKLEERDLVGRIKKAHEKGWHIDWSEDVASEAVLRTHDTSVTGRYIYKIVKELNRDPKSYRMPVKLFTVGRVFRNENLDYTHLADFYQSDGIIIGKGLTLANLFDTLIRVYGSMGIEVMFKPSYYPFVEPGAHVFMKYNDKWMEMGGSGIIRREIVGAKRKDISVLAWGLGLDRIVLGKDPEIKNLPSMYNENVGWLRERSRS